jgi:hypothetical protein
LLDVAGAGAAAAADGEGEGTTSASSTGTGTGATPSLVLPPIGWRLVVVAGEGEGEAVAGEGEAVVVPAAAAVVVAEGEAAAVVVEMVDADGTGAAAPPPLSCSTAGVPGSPRTIPRLLISSSSCNTRRFIIDCTTHRLTVALIAPLPTSCGATVPPLASTSLPSPTARPISAPPAPYSGLLPGSARSPPPRPMSSSTVTPAYLQLRCFWIVRASGGHFSGLKNASHWLPREKISVKRPSGQPLAKSPWNE